MTEITENTVEKALGYLSETDESAAKAKALMKALEHGFKTIAAVAFLEADGAQGERKEKAYASQEYKDHTQKYEQAMSDYELLANRRKRAELTIDVWRSMNAARKRGNI